LELARARPISSLPLTPNLLKKTNFPGQKKPQNPEIFLRKSPLHREKSGAAMGRGRSGGREARRGSKRGRRKWGRNKKPKLKAKKEEEAAAGEEEEANYGIKKGNK